MTKFSILTSLAVIVLLLVIPAVVLAQAQPPRPAVFGGTVSFDGAPATDGTSVSALIDGEEVASTETSGGAYALRVAQPPGGAFTGKAVVFLVGGSEAVEKSTWEADGGAELNLTATTPPPPAPVVGEVGPAGAAGPAGPKGSTGAAGKNGSAGATGAAGAQGKDGASGASGSAGADGAPGPAGSAGAKGGTGAAGPAGPAGPAGAAGVDGGGGALGLIALIIAIVAAIGAGGAFVMGRRS
ncbi:MAG: hypothetical protein VX638_10975 [Chloroflexota bacterium]|nr:hypothetical protein [Chloroflexota bacterium]